MLKVWEGHFLSSVSIFEVPEYVQIDHGPLFTKFPIPSSGIHLRALRGGDAAKCREDPLAALKTAIRRAEDEVHLYEEDNIRAPGLSLF